MATEPEVSTEVQYVIQYRDDDGAWVDYRQPWDEESREHAVLMLEIAREHHDHLPERLFRLARIESVHTLIPEEA